MSSNEWQSDAILPQPADESAIISRDPEIDKVESDQREIDQQVIDQQGETLTAFSLPIGASAHAPLAERESSARESLQVPLQVSLRESLGELPRELPLAEGSTFKPSAAVTRELFEQAVAVHSRRLLAIARAIVGHRASPEDVVQQAVMNLFQHRDRYDWRELGGLLKRAVVNESLRLLRPPKMSMVSDDHPDQSDTPVAGLIENETVRKVREAIAQLPDHFRAALVLCEYEKLSYVEIAHTLNASVPQVKTWLHRARRQLAKMLASYVEPDRAAGKM